MLDKDCNDVIPEGVRIKKHCHDYDIEVAECIHIKKAQREKLCQFFLSCMRSIAFTHAQNAVFDISEFSTAKEDDCEGFMLVMERNEYTQVSRGWTGHFTKGKQKLWVVGYFYIPGY